MEGLYERIVRLSGGLSKGFPSCLELHRVEPAATVIQLPALRRHLFGIEAAPTVLSRWIEPKSLLECVRKDAYAVSVEKARAGEVMTAS